MMERRVRCLAASAPSLFLMQTAKETGHKRKLRSDSNFLEDTMAEYKLEMKGIIPTMAGGTYHLLGLN